LLFVTCSFHCRLSWCQEGRTPRLPSADFESLHVCQFRHPGLLSMIAREATDQLVCHISPRQIFAAQHVARNTPRLRLAQAVSRAPSNVSLSRSGRSWQKNSSATRTLGWRGTTAEEAISRATGSSPPAATCPGDAPSTITSAAAYPRCQSSTLAEPTPNPSIGSIPPKIRKGIATCKQEKSQYLKRRSGKGIPGARIALRIHRSRT